MSTSTEVSERDELLKSFRDKRRRHHLAGVSIKRGLAEQIREMRSDRGWTQSDLARATNKAQATISQLENPDYGSYTIRTLERLGEAFDVALIVRFAPFSELATWVANLSPQDLAVQDYEHDSGLLPISGGIPSGNENGYSGHPGLSNTAKNPSSSALGVSVGAIDSDIRVDNVTSISAHRNWSTKTDVNTVRIEG